jgi:hypothetical protein
VQRLGRLRIRRRRDEHRTSTGWNEAAYFDDAVKAMYDARGGVT